MIFTTYTLIDQVNIEDLSLSSRVAPLSDGRLRGHTDPDGPLALVGVQARDGKDGGLGQLGGAWELWTS